ncbi:uncharacterized protein zgc:66455 isoform X2 [Ictalurus punctatus]|uniref:Uncharacterized protein zgc:66455 isoform X2 n=1 Tax=Ictalurus punctatus TaxID=7998 RepID=A0A2D0Q5M0_ICTPU|nr:uncharacterized protein zgc:66455 isoform X2 [Ictalurus punctatus]
MHRRYLLCKLCALLLIHVEAVAKCQMVNEHDAPMSAGSRQQNAFYALRSCHQILHGDRGEFFSPDYLCSNPALWCNWTIQVQPGKRVQVYLEDLTPEHVCHLKTDQIHLDESPVSAGERRILERCWRSSMYTSVSNTVHVVQLIRPNLNPPHRGFYGAYQAFGLPETPGLNEDISEDQGVEMEADDAVTKFPIKTSFSNELEGNGEDVHVEHTGVSHSINPQLNEIPTVTTGSFREIRKIRGGAKNQEEPFPGALPQDDVDDEETDELVSVPTEIPSWISVEKYTPMFDDGPHTLAPTHTTHSTSTSTVTTRTQSTKKRALKRKQSTATAAVKKNELTHFTQVSTQTPDEPAEAKMAEPSAPLVEDVGAVSMEMLKIDGALTLPAASGEHVGGLVENRTNGTKRTHGIKDCSKLLAPTLLYTVCFLLCFFIALLMVALGVMYRRYHHGTFLPRCQHSSSSSFTDNDINNNPNSGSGNGGSTSRSLPPPPPLHLAGGARDLPLLRFSPLSPPDGFEGKPQKENDTL